MKQILNWRWSPQTWLQTSLLVITLGLMLPALALAQGSVPIPCPLNLSDPGCQCLPGDPGCPMLFYSIFGSVKTPANVGVPNITVEIRRNGLVVRQAVTDSNGNFDAGQFRSGLNYVVAPVSCPSCQYAPPSWSTILDSDFFAAFTKSSRDNRADFDGDGKADISVFRGSNGTWYSLNSSNGAFVASAFGLDGDIITPGDYDNDSKTDRSVFRPSTKEWYIQYSSNGSSSTSSLTGLLMGDLSATNLIPVARDYDGDGKTDIALFAPNTGNWHIINSSDPGNPRHDQWGTVGDIAAPGDFDGDGKADLAVFRPSNGIWYIKYANGLTGGFHWGLNGDKPVQADYDGDCKTDIAVFRPSNTTWYILRSSDGGATIQQWGLASDQLVPADYNGDGKAEIAIYRGLSSGSQWWVSGSGLISYFGVTTDVTIPSGYIPQ